MRHDEIPWTLLGDRPSTVVLQTEFNATNAAPSSDGR